MKKTIITLCFLAFALMAKSESPLQNAATDIVKAYYNSFQTIAKNPLSDESIIMTDRLLDMAGFDAYEHDLSNVLKVSNDIGPVFETNSNNQKDISYRRYVTNYREYAIQKRFSFSYKILSCNIQKGLPSVSANANTEVQYVTLVVQKTFDLPNQTTNIEETITIAFAGNKASFSRITNKFGSQQTTGDILAEAFEKYRKRKYNEAFALFERVMVLSPNNADASYYLGIMLYKNQGCKDKYPTRKERDRKAIEYWNMSYNGQNAIKYYTR